MYRDWHYLQIGSLADCKLCYIIQGWYKISNEHDESGTCNFKSALDRISPVWRGGGGGGGVSYIYTACEMLQYSILFFCIL